MLCLHSAGIRRCVLYHLSPPHVFTLRYAELSVYEKIFVMQDFLLRDERISLRSIISSADTLTRSQQSFII